MPNSQASSIEKAPRPWRSRPTDAVTAALVDRSSARAHHSSIQGASQPVRRRAPKMGPA